ncbi:MAG: murein biosynthesis integral membrane protein MurJ [Alphaproteobacteria bacterium]|nr:murein biosynthesis integral membrane protein MurJ [Alphaproteobacteria bacterium]
MLIKAMATVAGFTGLSRIAGMVRDILTASILGAGPVADAFVVALKLPNFFRRITAEGAFNVSFVPLYTKVREEEGVEAARKFAGNAYSIMAISLLVLCAVFVVFMPWVVRVTTPGFYEDPERFNLAVEMSRISFPYLLFVSLAALLGGVLNAHRHFAPFAAAPLFFSFSLIGSLLIQKYFSFFETAGHAMAWGIFISGILQMLFLMIFTKRYDLKIKFEMPVFDEKVKKLFRLMGPGVIGASVVHINLLLDMVITSFLAAGSMSYLYYADRLNQLPLGLVGIAISTALLPLLSYSLVSQKVDEARGLFNRALEYSLMLSVPAAAALMIMPGPIIELLFQRGAFTEGDTTITAQALAAYSLGLPGYIGAKIFATAYWAKHDTMTPVRVAIIATVLNIVMAASFALLLGLGVVGIALATGITGWVQLFLMNKGLKTMEAAHFDEKFRSNIFKISMSVLLMALALFGLQIVLQHFMADGFTHLAAGVLVLVGAGGVVYVGMIFLTGAIKLSEILEFWNKRKFARAELKKNDETNTLGNAAD